MSLFLIIITIILALLFGGLSWAVVFLIREYLEHLERVYNMELFYGNEILLELLEHSRDYHEDIVDFAEKYGEGSNEKRKT